MLEGVAETDALRLRGRWTICFGVVGLALLLVVAQELGWPAGILPTIVAYVTLGGTIWLYLRRQYDETLAALRRKFEEQERLASALRAEIVNNARQARRLYIVHRARERVLRRMEQDAGYIPFAAVDGAGSKVYGALLDRIVELPAPAVRAVVSYYDADSGVDAAFTALQSAPFQALSQERRIQFVAALLEATAEVYGSGKGAPGAPMPRALLAASALRRHIAYCRAEATALKARQGRWDEPGPPPPRRCAVRRLG
jgi:hypothetical protein